MPSSIENIRGANSANSMIAPPRESERKAVRDPLMSGHDQGDRGGQRGRRVPGAEAADTGGVELSIEVKVAEVVTVTYFLGLVPPVQVDVQETVVPDTHSQNTV